MGRTLGNESSSCRQTLGRGGGVGSRQERQGRAVCATDCSSVIVGAEVCSQLRIRNREIGVKQVKNPAQSLNQRLRPGGAAVPRQTGSGPPIQVRNKLKQATSPSRLSVPLLIKCSIEIAAVEDPAGAGVNSSRLRYLYTLLGRLQTRPLLAPPCRPGAGAVLAQALLPTRQVESFTQVSTVSRPERAGRWRSCRGRRAAPARGADLASWGSLAGPPRANPHLLILQSATPALNTSVRVPASRPFRAEVLLRRGEFFLGYALRPQVTLPCRKARAVYTSPLPSPQCPC